MGFLFVEQRLPVCRYSSGWSGRGLIKRMRMRRGQVRTGKEFARSIIVKPPLACLETRDDRVASSCVVFRCMLTWRIIAAADVTTFGASAKMQPPTAGRQALNTADTTRLGRGIYALYLRPHSLPPTVVCSASLEPSRGFTNPYLRKLWLRIITTRSTSRLGLGSLPPSHADRRALCR